MTASSAWKRVWDKRSVDCSRGSTLSRLMAADGLDTDFGEIDESSWTSFVHRRAEELGIVANDSVFEVGCGAGAFLYELQRMGCRVSGIDQSAALVDIAGQSLPGGEFDVADAAAFDIGEPVDFAVSFGVFLYFPSLSYAAEVVRRMVQKARRAVAVLDIPDRATQDSALRYRVASAGGPEAYEARYRGLDHLYYDRSWFVETLEGCGLMNVSTASQDIPGYGNGPFRFNAWGYLPSHTGG